jgi:hypothetical protein
MRFYLTFITLIALLSAIVFAIDPPTGIPSQLQVPDNNSVLTKLVGVGTQNYQCISSNGSFTWNLLEAIAVLNNENDDRVGSHYFLKTPINGGRATWEDDSDHSLVTGKTIATVAAANTNNIALLLVQAVFHGNVTNGFFSDVTYIQRLNTINGVPRASFCNSTAVNDTIAVAYQADYWFYTNTSVAPRETSEASVYSTVSFTAVVFSAVLALFM